MAWVCLAALATSAGCGTSEHYRRGQDLQREGEYDQAIEAYLKAVQEDPYNRKYVDALNAAEDLAADRHVRRAEKLSEAGRVEQALKEVARAQDLMPAHPQAMELKPRLQQRIEQSEKAVQGAKKALAEGNWSLARKLAEQALQLNRNASGAETVIKQVRKHEKQQALAQAQRALEEEKWDESLKYCAKVKELDPGNAQVAELELNVANRKKAQTLTNQAETLARANDYAAALEKLIMACDLWPSNQSLAKKMQETKNAAHQYFVQGVEAAVAGRRYGLALGRLDEAQQVFPDDESIGNRRRMIRKKWLNDLLAEAEQYAADKQWAHAWAIGLQALVLSPGEARAERTCRQASEKLRQTVATQPAEAIQPGVEDQTAQYVRVLFREPRSLSSHDFDRIMAKILGDAADREGRARCKAWVRHQLGIKFTDASNQKAPIKGIYSSYILPEEIQLTTQPATRPAEAKPELPENLRKLDKRDLADLVRAGLVDPEMVPPEVLEEAKKREAISDKVARKPQEKQKARPADTVVSKKKKTSSLSKPKVFKGIVSRDDDRYPKELKTIDGIIVKVRDTDEDPLDADMEIRVGDSEKEYDDLRTGVQIEGRGLSGHRYQLTIKRIYDEEETVYFILERVD